MKNKQTHRQAARYIVISGLMFAIMGSCIKQASLYTSVEWVVFFRNLFGFVVLVPLYMKQSRSFFVTSIPFWHLIRSLAGLGAMYCFFYSIALIPLSESVLLSYTMPLFAPVMAYFLLGEQASKRLVIAIALGFIGVFLLLNPNLQSFSWPSLIALTSGFLAAIAMTSIRRMSKTEPALRIVFYYGLICTVLSIMPILLPENFKHLPDSSTLFLLLAVGLFAALGQLALTKGYSMATAAQVGPFIYSSVIFATILGLVFWQEVPAPASAFGIILVISAGSIALRQSKKR